MASKYKSHWKNLKPSQILKRVRYKLINKKGFKVQMFKRLKDKRLIVK